MDFSIYITDSNKIIIPVSDSQLYEYNNCCCKRSGGRTFSEKRSKSRNDDKQNKENPFQEVHQNTCQIGWHQQSVAGSKSTVHVALNSIVPVSCLTFFLLRIQTSNTSRPIPPMVGQASLQDHFRRLLPAHDE